MLLKQLSSNVQHEIQYSAKFEDASACQSHGCMLMNLPVSILIFGKIDAHKVFIIHHIVMRSFRLQY